MRLVDFELRHGQRVMAELPSSLADNTRRTIAQLMHRVLPMAVFPACVIKSNPLPPGFVPKPGKQKAMTYLYPDEDAALLKCTRVALVYRLLYGVLAREGMRTSEVLALMWRDLDLVRGTITLDRNKTDDPRAWVLDPGVAAALRVWRNHFRRGAPETAVVFTDAEGNAIPHHPLARLLRADLKKAGVGRPILFESSDQRQQLRAHDLRGTFVTLALANGKTETWVADRTGHKSSKMIYRYRRAARQAAELNLGWLHPLHKAIPETAQHHEQRARREQPKRAPRTRRASSRRPAGRH